MHASQQSVSLESILDLTVDVAGYRSEWFCFAIRAPTQTRVIFTAACVVSSIYKSLCIQLIYCK